MLGVRRRAISVTALAGVGYAALTQLFLLVAFPDWHGIFSAGALDGWLPVVVLGIPAVYVASVAAVALPEGRGWLSGAALVGALGPALGLALHRAAERLWWPGMVFGSFGDSGT